MIPRLLHAVDISIERIDKDETLYDPDTRAPIGQAARREEVVCPGQVKWYNAVELQMIAEGAVESANGYVLFRYVDLEKRGITIARGDRFTKLGNQDTDVYVVRLEPTVHLPRAGGAVMVKAHFADRKPTKG